MSEQEKDHLRSPQTCWRWSTPSRQEEGSTIFPAYRDDEKLIPRPRPRQGNLPLALIPVALILAFLLFSYVAGFAFYAHSSFSSGYTNKWAIL